MAGFAPAVKSQAKARIGMYGVGGSGKTMAALLTARGLVPGGRYALVDTEAGKSSAYADTFPFDTIILPGPYTAVRFGWCVDQAVKGGYDVLVFDGISPFWSGTGGILAVVDAAKKRGGGWSDGSPEQQKIVDYITGCPIHIIVTMRAKSDTVVDKENGKTTIKKIGMKYDQRDNLEYDLGWLLYLEHGTHAMTVEKTHMIGQEGKTYLPTEGSDVQPAEEFGKEIAEWLCAGVPLPEPTAAPAAPAPASPPPADPTPPAAPPAAQEPAQASEVDPVEAGNPNAAGPAPGDAQVTTYLERIAALTAIKERDWDAAFAEKFPEWFNRPIAGFGDLTSEEAGVVIERMEATRLALVNRQQQEAQNA